MSWSVASMRASRSLPFFFTLWQLMFSMRRFPRLSCKGGCYCPRCSYEWICKPFWSLWTGAYNDLPPLPLLTILFLLIFISACAFPLTAQYLTDFLVCRQKGLSKWYFFVSFFFPPLRIWIWIDLNCEDVLIFFQITPLHSVNVYVLN